MNKVTPNSATPATYGRRTLRRIGLGLLLLLLGAPAVAQVVTSLADNVGAPPAGSLRAALNTANASGTAATVTFNIPGGGTINLAGALPILRNPNGIGIDGANGGQGAITINGGASSATTGDRIFFVGVRASDTTGLVGTPSANWSISNLTLQNGNARGGAGGTGSNLAGGWSAGGGGAGLGGAIFVNEGSLSVAGVTFVNNRATGGNGGIPSAAVAEGGTGGGGGMGGTGGTGSFYNAGGGGGFGLGANGGIGAGGAGSAGRFVGATAGGAGAGTGFGAGGASGGGGGGSANNQNGGGGGPGGEAATTSGPPGGAGRAGNGAFGGGGGGAGGNNTQVGGNGGYGGGGGGAGAGDGGFGGFGGGGGGGAGNPIGAAGFAGGNGSTGYGGGGGGAGLGGAVFVRQGASLNVIGGGMSGGVVAGGTAGPGAGVGAGFGTAAFLAGSLDWFVASGQTVTLAPGNTLGGGSDPLISGDLTKSGPGTLVLGGNNNYVGATTVAAGDLRINGNNLGTGAVSVASGATLSGIGTLAGATSVASGGTVAPGQAAPGRLTTANLTLATGATVAAQITGATVATQYDQLAVVGTVNLGGATLSLSGAFVPAGGQSFVLIDNDGSDAVTGTFAGLAQGSTLTFNGVALIISYTGGDGNDVVLAAGVDPCAGLAFPYTLVGADNTALRANLIAAIECANANGAGADTIDLAGQTVALPAATPYADYSGQTALPQITSAINIRNGTLFHDLSGGGFLFRTFSIAAAGTLNLQNMVMSGDSAPTPGGAFHNSGTLNVTNSTMHGYDTNNRGGVLYNGPGATATFANAVFYNNNAVFAHVMDNAGTVSIVNSTFDKHNSIGQFGAILEGTGYTVRNSILWNPGSGPTQISAGNTVSDSIVRGGYAGGTNILNTSPLFVDETGNDFRLQSTSPAINIGVNANVPLDGTDVDGDSNTTEVRPDRDLNPRIVATVVDLGAFENQGALPPDPCDSIGFPYTVPDATPATLIQAIECANANGTADVIDLDGQTVTLTASVANYSGATGLPQITTPVTVRNGTITRAGANEFRFFAVGNTGSLTVRDLNLTNGGGATYAANGGAIISLGTASTLNVVNTTISGSQIGNLNNGSGIFSNAMFTIANSSVIGGSIGRGAIASSNGPVLIQNTLIAGNSGPTTVNGAGGVYFSNLPSATIVNSTIAGNYTGTTVATQPGGIFASGGTVNLTISNSIIWGNSNNGNTAPQVSNTSAGTTTVTNSLIQGGQFGALNSDPLFVTPITASATPSTAGNFQLADNSPAIDAGANANVPIDTFDANGNSSTSDEAPDRAGASRRYNDTGVTDTGSGTAPMVDIGAYEKQTNSINPAGVDYCNLQFPTSFTAGSGTQSPTIYGRIFEDDNGILTSTPGANASIAGQVGHGPLDSDPRGENPAWRWFPTTYSAQVGNDDEYQGTFTVPFAPTNTQRSYTYRFSLDGGTTYTYCDSDGNGTNGGLGFSTASLGTMTINPGAQPTLSINDVTLNEGNAGTTSFVFTIGLNGPSLSAVTFDIATADGTATVANGDYTGNSAASLVIPAGQTSTIFTVLVLGDTSFEPNETFVVNVTNVTGATVGDGQGTGTINNDDAAPDFTVTTTPTSIAVTDSTANGSTLQASEPTANTLRFNAAGRTFSVNGGPVITGNSGTLALPGITVITIDAPGGIAVATGAFFNIGASTLTSGSAITVAGGTLKATGSTAVVNAPVVLAANSDIAGTMTLAGPVSGDFTLRTFDAGTYRFTSTTSSFARLQIGSGTVELGGNNTLPPQIDVFNSASLNLNGFSQTVDFYASSGTTQNTGAAATLTLGVAGSASTFGTPNYAGPIIGPINLVIAAGAGQTLSSNSSSFTGTTNVLGALRITGSNALGATGPGNGTTIAATGSLDLRNVAYAGLEPLTINGGTVLTSSGNSSFPGPLALATAAATLRVDNAASELVLDGVLGGSQGFTKLGSGTVRLAQANTYTGPVGIDDGRVLVTGSTAAASTTTVSNGGTLGGTGTVNGPIVVATGGTLAPGVTVGTLHTANVAMASGATHAADITGATVDTQYDQLDVNGTVNLGGATLALSGAYVPATGESFTLIDNDGSDAVVGTFAGLPNNSPLSFNGVAMLIRYDGGTGNDVVLGVAPTEADIAITKTDGSATDVPGTAVTYAIVVTNAGPAVANSVTVSDTFPAAISGASFTVASSGGATCGANGSGNISQSVSLPVGASCTFTATGTVNPANTGTLSNTATAALGGGLTDPNPANNSATDTNTLTPQVDLAITKTDGQTSATAGTPIQYLIVASNNGPSNAAGSNVLDVLPAALAGATWTVAPAGGATCGSAGSGNIIAIVDLPAGGSCTFTVDATISAAATDDLVNIASIGAASGITDTTPGNNTATDLTTLTALPTLSIGDVTRNEGFNGVSAFDVTVTLSTPALAGGVTFDIATADDTATAGSDYVARNFTSVTIAEGSDTYVLSVPVNGDAVQEDNETFFVNVTNVTGANVADGQGLGTIVNDDIAGITVSPTTGLVTTEGGGTDTFTVVLGSQPTADVSLALSSSDATEGTVAPTPLVFTAGNWNTAQTVIVTGVDDAIVDGDVAYSIVTAPATSTDAFYSGINPADVSVSNTDDDDASVSITQSGGSNAVSEDGTTDSYSIVLGSQPTATVNMSISFPASDLSVNGDADGSFNTAFTTANWNIPQTITLAAVNDRALEGDHSASLVHAFVSSDATYNGIVATVDGGAATNSLTANITDNETAQLAWLPTSGSAAEGSDLATAVRLDITADPPGGTPTLEGTISYTLVPVFDTAEAADIGAITGALSFTNASDLASNAIGIAHLADALVEGAEDYSVEITLGTAPVGTSVAPVAFVGTIVDTSTATVSLGGSATIDESIGSSVLTVSLDLGAGNTLANAVSVAIDLVDDTATYAGGSGDYFFAGPSDTATVTFPAGSADAATQSVSVSIREDVLVETTESFSASLGAVTGTAITSGGPAVISITDNDAAVVSFQSPDSSVSEGTTPHSVNALLTISAVGTGTPALAVPISAVVTQTPGTAGAADYTLVTPSITFAAASVSGDTQPIGIAITDDLIVEGNETFSLGFGAVTGPATASGTHAVTLVDNDTAGVVVTQSGGTTAVTEGGATDTYTVVLTSQPTADVVITIDSGSQLGAAPAALTFLTADWNVPQLVTVSAVDDAVVEGDHGGVLSHVVSSGDSNYNGIGIPDVDADITDNDSAVVGFDPISVSQSESVATMTFSVTLSNPVASGVTLRVDSAFGTATAADFTPLVGGTVSFASDSTTPQTVSVSITNDALDENDESFTLVLSDLVATGDVTLGDAVATGTILDDAASPTLSITSPTEPEGDTGSTPMTFVVSLSTISGRDVTFTHATQDGTATAADNDYVPLPATAATIPAGELSISIPVLINGDAVFEGDETFSLVLSGIGNAMPADLTGVGTILEDDSQPTTTTITSDLPDPSVVGQPYTVMVSVDAQITSPIGSLTITDGTESCGPITLTAGTPPTSSASCELTGNTAGARTLTATYTPASDAFDASSDTEAHQVDAAATAISVSGPASGAINQPIAFTFALSVPAPGGGTPSGVVTLSTAGSSCDVVVPTATPSCELTFGTLGPATVSASFAPDNDDHLAATSSGAGNASTLVVAGVDLQLTKSDADAIAQPDATVSYTLSYRNVGSVDATGVVLTETVPANTRFAQAASSPGWSCADNAPAGTACALVVGTVAAGAPAASATFALRVDASLPADVDAVSNTASVADDGSNGEDATPADNIAVESTPVDASADLRVRKSTTATGFVPGQPVTYQLDYRNDGNRAATGVLVIETVPDDTVFVAASSTPGWSCADGAVGGTECAWSVGTVAAGEEDSLEFAVALRTGTVGGVIRNTVRIEDDGSNGADPTPDNNTSDVALSASNPAPPPGATVIPATGWPAHLLLMLALMLAGGAAWGRPRRR